MNKSDGLEKIFIAGGSGMVGSAIKREYIKRINNNELKNKKILTPSRDELDCSNFREVEKWFDKNRPNTVILAAAKVGGIYANYTKPAEFMLNNLKIQNNVIEISSNYEVEKFLFLGSSCIYPKFANQPIKEEELLSGSLEETNEFYALAKIAGIKLCESLRIQNNFNAFCLMPSNLYGPGDNYNDLDSHVMPALIKKFIIAKKDNFKSVTCWGDGKPLREFLYVDDLAKACLFILDNYFSNKLKVPKDSKGNPLFWLNVGSKSEISIKNLAEKISKIIGYEGLIQWDKNKPNGILRKKLDTSKLDKLGWEPIINIDLGIKLTIEAFKEESKKNILRI